MRLHANARTCPQSRCLLCERVCVQGWTLRAAAEAAGVSVRTAGKWLRRYREQGEQGLRDRSSAPQRVANRTEPARLELIALLRRGLRLSGAEIAELVAMPLSTVSAILTRSGLGKLSRLEPLEPPNRYQRRHPGELIHIDIKRLPRIDPEGRHDRHQPRKPSLRRQGRRRIGFEYAHIAIDDATRLAFVELLEDEKAASAVGFLQRSLAFYGGYGIRVQAVMTDNGACYRSVLHALACRTLRLKHLRTRPYRPRTNGKAERFIQSALREWAYRRPYTTSYQRRKALPRWLHHYNFHRKHHSLAGRPPASRVNNLFSHDS